MRWETDKSTHGERVFTYIHTNYIHSTSGFIVSMVCFLINASYYPKFFPKFSKAFPYTSQLLSNILHYLPNTLTAPKYPSLLLKHPSEFSHYLPTPLISIVSPSHYLQKRQIFREAVLPSRGGVIPDGAFTRQRLQHNINDQLGVQAPDGLIFISR